jgi:hypothetical protein
MLKTTGSLSSSAAFLLLLANAAAPSLLPAAASSFASRYGLIALCAAMGLQALAALCGGTTGAFEVLEERPGKPARVLHSKLATGEMPEVDAVLAMLKEIRVKPIVAGMISQIAAASYMAYLAHPVVLHMTKFVLPTRHDALVTVILTYFGTIAAGMAGAWIWQQVTARVSGLFSAGAQGRVATAT